MRLQKIDKGDEQAMHQRHEYIVVKKYVKTIQVHYQKKKKKSTLKCLLFCHFSPSLYEDDAG